MSTLTNKIFSLWQALLLILLTASVCVGVLFLIPLFQSDEELYREAVKDAMTIEEEETAFELVTLTAYQNNNVKWNEDGDRCLLLLWILI